MHYTIDELSKQSLNKLLQTSIYQIYAPYLHVSNEIFTSSSFSVFCIDNWVNFTSSYQAINDYENILSFKVTISDSPTLLSYDPKKKRFLSPTCNIVIENSKVLSISILSDSLENDIVFDVGVVIHLRNHTNLLFLGVNSISDQIDFIYQQKTIEKFTRKLIHNNFLV